MANTLKKDSIVFIDEVNGFNSGINVIELKETLRKVGIVWYIDCLLFVSVLPIRILQVLLISFIVFLRIAMFDACYSSDDMKRAVPRSDCNSETESGIEDIRCKHAELCSLAVSQGKVIVSIEHILALNLS